MHLAFSIWIPFKGQASVVETKSWMFWMDLVSKIGCSFSLHCRHCPLVAVTPFSTKGLRCFITARISSPDHGLFIHRLDETRKPEQLKKRLEDKKRCTCKDVLAGRDVAVQNCKTNWNLCRQNMCGNKLTRSAKNEVGLFSLTWHFITLLVKN